MSSILRRKKNNGKHMNRKRITPGPNGELIENERSLMDSQKTKEELADYALRLLEESGRLQERLDYVDFYKTKVHFAYIFEIDSKVHAMFRVVTDKKEYLFGVQYNDMILLDPAKVTRLEYEVIRRRFIGDHTNLIDVYGDVDKIPWKNVLRMSEVK